MMGLPRFAVTSAPLDVAAIQAAVLADAATPVGALDLFVGLVRAENLGRQVQFLVYEAYEPLAVRVFEQIGHEIAGRWAGVTGGIHHRIGRLEIAEASIVIGAASPHRADAFAACRYAIERVKQIAPIWKHEHFDGGDVWIEGARADPADESARAEALRAACG